MLSHRWQVEGCTYSCSDAAPYVYLLFRQSRLQPRFSAYSVPAIVMEKSSGIEQLYIVGFKLQWALTAILYDTHRMYNSLSDLKPAEEKTPTEVIFYF